MSGKNLHLGFALIPFLLLVESSPGGWQVTAVEGGLGSGIRPGANCSLHFNNGYPAIVHDVGTVVRYTWKDASGWHGTQIDNPGGIYGISLAVNAGYPAVSYRYMAGADDLKYAWQDANGWHYTIVDADLAGTYSSLKFVNGYPAISHYSEGGTLDLRYSWLEPNGWHTVTVDSAGDVGRGTSLDFNGSWPGIGYTDSTHGSAKYAWLEPNGWHTVTVPGTAGTTSERVSLDIDKGYPHIALVDGSVGALRYAWEDASGWHLETVDSNLKPGTIGMFSLSIAMYNGDPYISYRDGYKNMKFAWHDPNGWHSSVVYTGPVLASWNSLAFNGNVPAIAFYDDLPATSESTLYYAVGDPIPEPGTLSLLAIGTGWLARRRRRR